MRFNPKCFSFMELAERLKMPYAAAREMVWALVASGHCKCLGRASFRRVMTFCMTAHAPTNAKYAGLYA